MRVVALPIVCQAKRSRGIAAVLLLCAAACARTGLSAGDLGDGDLGAGDASSGGSATSGIAGKPNGGAPMIDPLPTSGRSPVQMGGTSSLPIGEPTACVPSTEACNGRDDDCNGAVDDVPAEACPGGGFRYCVAARMSECPRRCDVCVAGSVRICQNPFCSFWGEQECAADGQGFGHCREAQPPPECRAIARKFENSKQLEQCCLENGYCCWDQYDIDGDGDRGEMLGACGDIACQ